MPPQKDIVIVSVDERASGMEWRGKDDMAVMLINKVAQGDPGYRHRYNVQEV